MHFNKPIYFLVALLLLFVVLAGVLLKPLSSNPELKIGGTASYYIDSMDGDDANDGQSSSSPWKTLNKLNSLMLVPGSRVLFRRGGHWFGKLHIRFSGTAEDPITYGAYGVGQKPILDGSGRVRNLLEGFNSHYVVIQDLAIVGWRDRGVFNRGGNRWVLRRLRVEGGDSEQPDHGIRFLNSSGEKINGGTIANNEIGPIGLSEQGGIYFQAILASGVDELDVAFNDIHAVNAGGITLSKGVGIADGNERILLRNNRIFGCTSGIAVWNSNNSTIKNNVIRDGKGLGIGISYQSNFAKIEGNLIYNLEFFVRPNLWNGIDIANDSHNGSVFHNTVAKVARHSLVLAEDGGVVLRGWQIRNNIFDSSENSGEGIPGADDLRALAIGVRNAQSFGESNNILFSGERRYALSVGQGDGVLYELGLYRERHGQGEGSLDRKPMFVDPQHGDFRLRKDSPAIAMGKSGLGVVLGADGKIFCDRPSVGAFEYRDSECKVRH